MSHTALLERILELKCQAEEKANRRLTQFQEFFPQGEFSASAYNLAYYLALREVDLREIQEELSILGISSLGRGEAHIADNLDKVINLLCYLSNKVDSTACHPKSNDLHYANGQGYLTKHTCNLLGDPINNREVRIMVTLPGEAYDDYHFIRSLIDAGMNCARINSAHDNEETWLALIQLVKKASKDAGKSCKILMDLGGQKIRTGDIESGASVYHIKTKTDEFGKVIAPGRIKVLSQSQFIEQADNWEDEIFHLAINDQAHSKLSFGDRLDFIDIRGKRRYLEISERQTDGSFNANCWRTAYINPETKFNWKRFEKRKTEYKPGKLSIKGFQTSPAKIRVFRGDALLLTQSHISGRPALLTEGGSVMEPARIPITQDKVFEFVKVGAPVWIDDGKIGALVENITENGLLLRIHKVRPQGALIKSDKGVNFPSSELNLPALTEKDISDLDFITQHADMVAFSFVQTTDDMTHLLSELEKRNAKNMPVIAKIETAKAVKNLADIILSSIGRTQLGIMIARGDLAVEIGSVRMAEIQEEILWLCEAAHVPVIWATQVLETLAKQGVRSRPEITDAAMSVRAECVMLNKGPYILEALRVLDDILIRMQEHQHKKTSRLRALHQWSMADADISQKRIFHPCSIEAMESN